MDDEGSRIFCIVLDDSDKGWDTIFDVSDHEESVFFNRMMGDNAVKSQTLPILFVMNLRQRYGNELNTRSYLFSVDKDVDIEMLKSFFDHNPVAMKELIEKKGIPLSSIMNFRVAT